MGCISRLYYLLSQQDEKDGSGIQDPEVQKRMLEWVKVFDRITIDDGAVTINTDSSVVDVVDELQADNSHIGWTQTKN